MSSHEEKKQAAIDLVCQKLADQYPKQEAQLRQNFAQLYYSESIPKEVIELSLEDMLGENKCLWNHIQQRTNDQVKVHIYQPNYEEHEWESSHSVIDIVCPDTPFLITSITNAIARLGHTIYKTTHPVLVIERDDKGRVTNISPFTGQPDEPSLEAVMRFEVAQLVDSEAVVQVRETIFSVIKDVWFSVADWRLMRDKMQQVIDQLSQQTLPVDDDVKEENLAFLNWTANNHFTFIGYRYSTFEKIGKHLHIQPTPNTGLGTFRDENCQITQFDPTPLNSHQAKVVLQPQMLVITKSSRRSTVHRSVNFDYLGIKKFDDKGKIVGEHRFFGLYASAAYTARVHEIPVLRRKSQTIQNAIQALPGSHKSKALQHVLNNYPRDEMLQAPVAELLPIVQGVLQTQERNTLRLFLRLGLYGRFLTALVYVPREKFHTQLRMQLQGILMAAFQGSHVDFNVSFSDQPMARVQLTVHGHDLHSIDYDIEELEQSMRYAMLSWHDHFHGALFANLGEAEGQRLWHRYEKAFPLSYQEKYSPKVAVKDLQRLESLGPEQGMGTYLYQNLAHQGAYHDGAYRPTQTVDCLNFKVFGQGHAKALSDVLPILEHMGVRVINAHPYVLSLGQGEKLWIIDFVIQLETTSNLDIEVIKSNFQEAFSQAYKGRIASDRFNSLVLAAGLEWRETELIRAMSAYLRQIQVPFSKAYMSSTLNKHAQITQLLVQLFHTRFNPQNHTQVHSLEEQENITAQINGALDQVSNLNEDRMIKYFLACTQAILRCNYYQTDAQGERYDYLSFKIDPKHIPGMPLPLPMYEIFVYSNWVEAVHLRGGKVARGGLRWSDRHQDYRTEVLGLAKAQMVKNAVIVPLGAKGGFVCKQLPQTNDRETVMNEVVRCYSTFIQAMIDITDNIVEQKVVSPQAVISYDEDDPYLVVAADKGTATFSDIANGISQANNFWLGDAFASGGENGYDHKKMGITARGAWESVKRLFAEQGRDCQTQHFTAIGIGDMGGDVFGNGMLLSEYICLQVAFNHMHIFIDPAPDAKSSYEERQRLFNLPRSSWADYDRSLISEGGGIFERSAKSIPLSVQMRDMLATQAESMTPNELIQRLLKMPVDLFWNGGIGTYVKANHESHTDIGDPANDALRVNGNELGAKIVGEGGNLGFSQHGRIEFAQAGGLINTDAIDNSGGVDSSDHEVNIKILLSQVVEAGDLTLKQRNTLLASMTDEVADLVLAHNYHQSLVLSIAHHAAPQNIYNHKRLMHYLESLDRLNRQLEGLPTDANIDERIRQNEGLTRPEIAVLLAYSKMHLFDELMAADIAADNYLGQTLTDYFPKPLQEQFSEPMENHALRAEIIATHVTNQIGNRMGATFYFRLQDETGAQAGDIARAFVAASRILGAEQLWQALDAATLALNYQVAMDLHSQIQDTIEAMVQWLLVHHMGSSIDTIIGYYGVAMGEYREGLGNWLPIAAQERIAAQQNALQAAGLGTEAAQGLAQLEFSYYGLDIAHVANQHQHSVADTGQLWFALYQLSRADWLNQSIAHLPANDAWQSLARNGLGRELETILTQLTAKVMQVKDLATWQQQNQVLLVRMEALFDELQTSAQLDLAKVSVALGELGRL